MADWYFRGGPSQSNLQACPGCRNLVRRDEEFCPFCARRLRPEGGMRGLVRKIFSRPDAMTRILLGMIIAFFLLQMVTDRFVPSTINDEGRGGLFSMLTSKVNTYYLMGSNLHAAVAAYHQYWRWVTSCFLHFGLLHILFNGWVLWDLGRLTERLWGAKQVFATFILAGIAGSAVSFGWNMLLGHGANSAGASGAICGLLGLTLGAYYRNRWSVGQHLGGHLVQWAVYILVFGLVMRADNAAHIGGMIAGAALGYFLPPTQQSKTPARDKKIWSAAMWLALALMLVSFGFAAVWYAEGIAFFQTLPKN